MWSVGLREKTKYYITLNDEYDTDYRVWTKPLCSF